MKRIIIVGNGFDLAHNLKTGYGDFLTNYLESAFKFVYKNKQAYNDKLMTLSINDDYLKSNPEYTESVQNILSSTGDKSIGISGDWKVVGVNSKTQDRPIQLSLRHEFFFRVLREGKWSDIEGQYLKFILDKFQRKIRLEEKVSSANECLIEIKNLLIRYLTNEYTPNNISLTQEKIVDFCLEPLTTKLYSRFFETPPIVLDSDSDGKEEIQTRLNLDEIMILNFNYTNLFDHYLKRRIRNSNTNIIVENIHGSIQKPESVVFGYGDDTHPGYKEMEEEGLDSLLENMKPFYYPSQQSYLNMVDFIESSEFDVYVVGHSLGLSDRVLLKTIFENENCRAIRLFYRKSKENHFKKRISLSRHFKNKIAMRRKIVEYDENGRFN